MKHIVKRQEPGEFSAWKELANEDWQPAYGDLAGSTKQAVKHALMVEQGFICCYCEQELTDDDSHIEHFRPQSDPAVDPLDFANMLCSCQNQLKQGEPRHCGNLKGDWFEEERLVSPFDPDCEACFAFTGDGRIRPVRPDHDAAAETIRQLGLDIPKLIDLRAKAIEPFLDDQLTGEDMRRFVGGYLEQDDQGRFGEFWTTIDYLFGDFVSA